MIRNEQVIQVQKNGVQMGENPVLDTKKKVKPLGADCVNTVVAC